MKWEKCLSKKKKRTNIKAVQKLIVWVEMVFEILYTRISLSFYCTFCLQKYLNI